MGDVTNKEAIAEEQAIIDGLLADDEDRWQHSLPPWLYDVDGNPTVTKEQLIEEARQRIRQLETFL